MSREKLLGAADMINNLFAMSPNKLINYINADIVQQDWKKIAQPNVIIHCAGQVSHPRSIQIPETDFQINAWGTFRLLNHARKYWPKCKFIHISTAKIYGENVDKLWPYEELETRYWYSRGFPNVQAAFDGVNENCSFDQTMKTPFGCSKVAADMYVQEYGRLYGMQTAVLRPGVFTGPYAKPVIWQNWLGDFAAKVMLQDHVDIIGWKGKQVRDVLHTDDLVSAIMLMIDDMPHNGDVFNIGGGMGNDISLLEAFERICKLVGRRPTLGFLPNREGDWCVYVTDNSKLKDRYPQWDVKWKLEDIILQTLNKK